MEETRFSDGQARGQRAKDKTRDKEPIAAGATQTLFPSIPAVYLFCHHGCCFCLSESYSEPGGEWNETTGEHYGNNQQANETHHLLANGS